MPVPPCPLCRCSTSMFSEFRKCGCVLPLSVTRNLSPDQPIWNVHAVMIRSPAASNLRKSPGLVVAKEAPPPSATAPIMQSINVPRRRPEILNNRAAAAASSSVNDRRSGTIRSARVMSFFSTGPHKNSAQAIELIVTGVLDLSHSRNLISSEELRTSARIRKPVSRWIIACAVVAVTMMRGALSELYEPTPALWRESDATSPADDLTL